MEEVGSGKSEYCYQEIKNLINNKEKIYIITPEQFSFTAEKKLLDTIGSKSVINAEVLSFNRMAQRVFKEVGGATKTHLSKCGRTMLIYDILNRQKKNLKFLSQAEKNIDVALNIITELKKHNITQQMLQDKINKIQDVYLKTKIEDLITIYSVFQDDIKDKYIDENDVLTLLAEKLPQSKEFENTIIYIDEFVGFTAQEYEIIKQLLKKAKKVTVCVTADVNLDTNLTQIDMNDLFYETKRTASKLTNCAKDVNKEIEKPIILQKTHRFKTEELQYIEKNLFENRFIPYKKNIKNVQLFLATNPYSEIENVAKEIINLVKNESYRYQDISIITKNIETYSSITKAIFSKYGIPVFIDEKKELNENGIAKYILSILEVLSKNWSYEAMFQYLKNPLSGIDATTIYKLEQYALKWGIKSNKWLAVWHYQDTQTAQLEKERQKIIQPLYALKQKINEQKDYTNMTKELYKFLEQNKLDKKIEDKIEELEQNGLLTIANEYKNSIHVITEVFEELVMVFKDQKTTFEKYKEILKIGLNNIHIASIPASIDQVILGDVERSKNHKVKATFIIGLNDGMFPSNIKQEGFLNDNDRECLKEQEIELASGTLQQIYAEQLNIYKTFTIAEEKLFLSYTSADKDGKTQRASTLISKIKKRLVNLKIQSDIIERKSEITVPDATFDELLLKIKNEKIIEQKWKYVYEWYNSNKEWNNKLEAALKGIHYTNLPERLTAKNIEALYGKTIKTSVSKLEQYRKCPFSFYLKYGLNIQEQHELQLRPIDTGSFIHEVLDEFFNATREKDVKKIETEEIKRVVNNIIQEKLNLPKNYIFSSTPKLISLTNKLKKVILQSIEYLIYQLKCSDFKILGNEVEFKEGKKYPPIQFILENGTKVEMTGKIDRIDEAINCGKRYVRIIDYKSSNKTIDLNEVVNGLQIQLITYLDRVTQNEEVIPAGILYFSLLDPIIKKNRNLSDEEIKEAIQKEFKMQGLILEDNALIKMMDNKLQNGYSNIIPVYMKSDGTISETSSSTIKEQDFINLQNKVQNVIKQILAEIIKGKIEIKPYRKKRKDSCEYCNYKPICQFEQNNQDNEYFTIPEKKKQQILAELKE